MSELLNRLSAYGVDIPSVLDRFVGDEELYDKCLFMFFEDKAFSELSAALNAKNYQLAFESAHTLKGVSANLGLTPLYDAICKVVEALRIGDNDKAQLESAGVRDEFERLKKIVS